MAKLGNAGPLGLFSFALTTFVISCYNAGVFGVKATDPMNGIVGLALFYGGLAQAFSGMWEFARGNTFGATAFASYGAFWICNGAFYIPSFGVDKAYANLDSSILTNAKSIFLLGWTIFTLIMTFACVHIGTPRKLTTLFVFVLDTFVLLTTAEFGELTIVKRIGGFVGLVTAVLAWYNAIRDLLEHASRPTLSHPKSSIYDVHQLSAMESQKVASSIV